MAVAEKSRERVFIKEFLKLYQSLPALWNTKCKEYNDRLKKQQSYSIMLAKYCQRYPSATKDDVRKKINTLRSNYRKTKHKYSDELIRESKCWYYNDIRFLEDPDPEQHTSFISVEEEQPQEQPRPAVAKGTQKSPVTDDSEHMRIAWVWANELAKAAPDQQMYAKKAINDILFEAQMGTLSRHSVLINDSPHIVNYYTQKAQE